MKWCFLIFGLWSLIKTPISGQSFSEFKASVDVVYFANKENRIHQLDSILSSNLEIPDRHKSYLIHKIGVAYYVNGQIDSAITKTLTALNLRENAAFTPLLEHLQSLYNLGIFHKSKNEIRESLSYYSKIQSIDSCGYFKYDVLWESAISLKDLGEYDMALELVDKAEAVSIEENLDKKFKLDYLRLSIFEEMKGRVSKESIKRLGQELINRSAFDPYVQADVFHRYGEVLRQLGFYEKAVHLFRSSLQNYQKQGEGMESSYQKYTDTDYWNKLSIIANHTSLGSVLSALNHEYEALEHLDAGLDLFDFELEDAAIQLYKARLYIERGKVLSKIGQVKKAFDSFNHSFQILVGDPTLNLNRTRLPEEGIIDVDLTRRLLLAVLQNSEELNLDAGEIDNVIQMMDEAIDRLINRQFANESKMHWRDILYDSYYLSFVHAIEQNDFSRALYFSEKSKALLLLDNMTRSVQITDETYQNLMRGLTAKLYTTKDSTMRLGIRRKLDSLTSSRMRSFFIGDALQKITKVRLVELNEITNQLGVDQTVLVFMSDSKKTFVLRIEADEIECNELKHFDKNSLNSHLNNDEKQMKGNAENEIKELLLKCKRDVTIIPDANFASISFESFLGDEAFTFLTDRCINYQYSLSIERFLRQQTVEKDHGVLAMAPAFGTSALNNPARVDNLRELPMAKAEVNTIVKSVGGVSVIDDQATKDRFLDLSENYNMVHLATHANVNWNNSNLSVIHFTSDHLGNAFLTLDELQHTWVPLEMTVLSACETGLGQLNRGEGLMSLARGFFAAGSKSVITSLWKADDESTYKIMTAFYKYLARGQRKDEALRNAKLEYLENCDPLKSSPFYWAAFIPIGDMSPIRPVPWHLRWWFWPCIILIIGSTAGYDYQRSRKRRAA